MKSILYIFLLAVSGCFSTSLAQDVALVNTVWVADIGGCQDFIEFKKDNVYQFVSCETGDTIYGVYSINDNKIILKQMQGVFDNEFPEKSKHRTPKVKFVLLLENSSIYFKERWEPLDNGKWIKSSYKFSDDYCFVKSE